MKKLFSRFLPFLLALTLILCAGCNEKAAPSTSDNTSSTLPEDPVDDRPRGEALLEKELPFEKYIYEDGFYLFGKDFPTLNFDEAKSPYGEKSIHIIGDSISHGMQAGAMYNYNYPTLLKNSLNKMLGTNNWGFVSPFSTDMYGSTELHTFSAEKGGWVREAHVVNTPGFTSYTSGDIAGSTALITVDRKKDGYDRHINGFYVYYTSGPSKGGFDITVNGTKVYSVAAGGSIDTWARTDYIAIPEGLKNELEIRIVKTDSGSVTINGICYAEADNEGVFVHNYSLSGMTLTEVDYSLLSKMCNANYVILALGYNDGGSGDIEVYQQKAQYIAETCLQTGATLICLDFMWPKPNSTTWATDFKNALFDAAHIANGYYIDFTGFYKVDPEYLLADSAHPTANGYKLVARKLCYFFGIPFSSDLG